jgi:hypothetical protein
VGAVYSAEEEGKRKGSTKNGGREWGKREERCSGGHVLVDPAQFDGVANALNVLLVVVAIELGSFGVGGTAEVRKVSVGFHLNWCQGEMTRGRREGERRKIRGGSWTWEARRIEKGGKRRQTHELGFGSCSRLCILVKIAATS